MTHPEASNEELTRLIGSIDIPACPEQLAAVMVEAQKDLPDLQTLSKLIAADVGMSAAAIKLANSPLYRPARRLDSVPQAVTHLGTRNIVCIAISVALKSHLSQGLPQKWLEDFWRRAGHSALGAGLLAKSLRGTSPDAAYTYALFHDAAMPLMLRRFPDYLTTLAEADEAGLDRVVMENRRHGCSHALIGALLGRNWGMPRELIAATRAHHDSEALISAREDMQGLSPTLIAIGHVAEDLVDQLYGEQTVAGQHTAQTSAIYLELEPHDLLEVREALEVAIEEREPFLQRQTFNQSH